MQQSRKNLPSFDDPPVVEVVAGIQFEPLELPSAWMGMWWNEIRLDFPHTEDQRPLESVIEQFGSPQPPKINVQVVSTPPLRRLWFMDKPDGNQLLQVQDNRLNFNWRGHDGNALYPRYEYVRDNFSMLHQKFEKFLKSNKFQKPEISQCELTYVNYIYQGNGWNDLYELHKIFSFIEPINLSSKNLSRESFNFRIVENILDSKGTPFARLYITSDIRHSLKDGKKLVYLELSVKGDPKYKTSKSITSFLDMAHEHIVTNFAEVTTPHMHSVWRRKDVSPH